MVKEGATETVQEQFRGEVQNLVSEIMGKKVSRSLAYKLFKALSLAPYQFCLKQEFDQSTITEEVVEGYAEGSSSTRIGFKTDEQRLAIAGVGVFEIRKSKSRGARANAGQKWTPMPKFISSLVLDNKVNAHFGFPVWQGNVLVSADSLVEHVEIEDNVPTEIPAEEAMDTIMAPPVIEVAPVETPVVKKALPKTFTLDEI